MTKCPSCGFEEANLNKRQTNEMHKYVSEKGHTVLLNDNEHTVELKGVTYTRADKVGVASQQVGLREDGPTLEEYIAKGYKAENYPPAGYAARIKSVAEGLTGIPVAPLTELPKVPALVPVVKAPIIVLPTTVTKGVAPTALPTLGEDHEVKGQA